MDLKYSKQAMLMACCQECLESFRPPRRLCLQLQSCMLYTALTEEGGGVGGGGGGWGVSVVSYVQLERNEWLLLQICVLYIALTKEEGTN